MYYLKRFHSHNELKKAIENDINFYSNKRFNDMTPIEVCTEALNVSDHPTRYPIKENKCIQN